MTDLLRNISESSLFLLSLSAFCLFLYILCVSFPLCIFLVLSFLPCLMFPPTTSSSSRFFFYFHFSYSSSFFFTHTHFMMCGSLSWIRNKIIYIKLNERKCISLYFSFHSKQILEMDDTKKYLFNPMLFFIVKRVSLLATVKLKYKKKKKIKFKIK